MVIVIAVGVLLCNSQLAQGKDFSGLIEQRRKELPVGLMLIAMGCTGSECICGEQCAWVGGVLSCSGACTKEELQFIASIFPKPKPEDTQSSTQSPTLQP